MDYKQVLSTNVRTKSMTEEERKAHRAEQKDFRDKLVRKIGEYPTFPPFITMKKLIKSFTLVWLFSFD